MATIEERAEAAYPVLDEYDMGRAALHRSGYIRGAEDQQRIDTEKACELLQKNSGAVINSVFIELFRKEQQWRNKTWKTLKKKKS